MKLGTRLLIDGIKNLNKKAEKSAFGQQDGRNNVARFLRQLRRSFAGDRKRTGCHYLKLLLNVLA